MSLKQSLKWFIASIFIMICDIHYKTYVTCSCFVFLTMIMVIWNYYVEKRNKDFFFLHLKYEDIEKYINNNLKKSYEKRLLVKMLGKIDNFGIVQIITIVTGLYWSVVAISKFLFKYDITKIDMITFAFFCFYFSLIFYITKCVLVYRYYKIIYKYDLISK